MILFLNFIKIRGKLNYVWNVSIYLLLYSILGKKLNYNKYKSFIYFYIIK